ncbi:MAG: transcriptional repressor [Chloroflexi bacterium]|nr:transcriptional repressor [Chloroflexota bacterium]
MLRKTETAHGPQVRLLRATRSRRAVMEAVIPWAGLFSAEELCRALPSVSRATVYRALAYLQEIGVVCRVPAGSGAPRYRTGSPRHHHHLVCVRCGAVQDIARCDLDAIVRSITDRFGYEPVDHRLEVYGRCATCCGQDV